MLFGMCISGVSYKDFTSNHNCCAALYSINGVFLIKILHQTTTEELEKVEKG